MAEIAVEASIGTDIVKIVGIDQEARMENDDRGHGVAAGDETGPDPTAESDEGIVPDLGMEGEVIGPGPEIEVAATIDARAITIPELRTDAASPSPPTRMLKLVLRQLLKGA